MGQLNEPHMRMRSTGSPDTRLERMWRCPLHRGCYSAEHFTVEQVRQQATRCPLSCRCWRHAVIRIVDNGRLPQHEKTTRRGE